MSEAGYESLPVFDPGDMALVGWESGQADDGDMVLQVRCPGCGIAHSIKLPPGAYIRHEPPGVLSAEDVQFYGPMKPPALQEPG